MQMNYLMICEGHFTLPQINHTLLDAQSPAEAHRDLTKIVEKLYIVGYRRFTLFDVRSDHKLIGYYDYKAVDPVIEYVEA